MSRILLSSTILLLLVVPLARAQDDQPVKPLARAIARAAETNATGEWAMVAHPPGWHRPRPARRPSVKRAVITGFLVGAVVGGTITYREYGAEGVWLGVYTLGGAGALVGWTVSQ